jgi:uncharacterized membrane-anchored protein YhcB (DUF1043 family)
VIKMQMEALALVIGIVIGIIVTMAALGSKKS